MEIELKIDGCKDWGLSYTLSSPKIETTSIGQQPIRHISKVIFFYLGGNFLQSLLCITIYTKVCSWKQIYLLFVLSFYCRHLTEAKELMIQKKPGSFSLQYKTRSGIIMSDFGCPTSWGFMVYQDNFCGNG